MHGLQHICRNIQEDKPIFPLSQWVKVSWGIVHWFRCQCSKPVHEQFTLTVPPGDKMLPTWHLHELMVAHLSYAPWELDFISTAPWSD